MERLLEQSGLPRVVLDALPLPVFVVDRDFRLHYHNPAAAAFIGAVAERAVLRLSGDELHCVDALSSPQGCGTAPGCPGCVLRSTVAASVAHAAPVKKRWTLQRVTAGGPVRQHLFITALTLPGAGEPLRLLVFEDITEIVELRGLLPICAGCKKIRNDRDYWEQVEHYLARQFEMTFTHGMCPECLEQYYPAGTPGRKSAAGPPPADRPPR